MPAQFFAYDGYGQTARESAYYSQAVRIGNRIECAGQGTVLFNVRQPRGPILTLVFRWLESGYWQ